MVPTRKYKAVALDGGQNPPQRITVTYEAEPSSGQGMAARLAQISLIQLVAESPDLLSCGLVPFETMTVKYNGISWVMTLEANSGPTVNKV